jgi:hypothetical protein
MITVRTDILARSIEGLNRRKTALEDSANKQYRQKVYGLFKELLSIWPQFSGDTVSNWRIVKSPSEDPGYQEWPEKLAAQGLTEPAAFNKNYEPHQAGDPTAVNFAFTRSKFVQFTYKDKVHFVNATPLHFGDGTVSDLAGITHALRPANTQIISDFDRISTYLKAFAGRQYGSTI